MSRQAETRAENRSDPERADKKIQTDDSRDVDYARVDKIRATMASGGLTIEPENCSGAGATYF